MGTMVPIIIWTMNQVLSVQMVKMDIPFLGMCSTSRKINIKLHLFRGALKKSLGTFLEE